MSTPATVLELRDLHKRLGATDIICGASLSVAQGERVALIGPNGAGKSTLFNLVSGLLVPDQGSILLGGRRIDGMKPFAINRLGLARSFQITNVFPQLSVQDNLRCGALWSLGYGYALWSLLSRLKDVNERAEALMCRMGLQHRRETPAAQLSYAEQRALELGITMASDPQVVLLDEPTAGMNHSETERCVALIREVTQGKTLLMIEHDMGVVFDLADKVAVLSQGAVIAFDTPDAVRANARVQEAYLGSAAT